ncbi:ALP1-like protein [Tanacetum coccineum]
MAYFSEHPQYDETTFRDHFRMSRRVFTKIVQEVTDTSPFLQQRDDCTGQLGISSLMKCNSAIHQLAYGSVPYSLDEYLQMGATTACKSIQIFCNVIMNLYGEEFLRKPTYTDMEKLYARHDEKHGFPGMLGSIDSTHWPWANCPVAYRAQFSRGGHGPDPFILLEAIASNDLWIWHAFFGVSEMNNDVNVLRQSFIFTDLKSGRASDVPFVANNCFLAGDIVGADLRIKMEKKNHADTHSSMRRVITDTESGRSSGYGFVNYDNDELANEAMKAMDGHVVSIILLKDGVARMFAHRHKRL